MKVKDKLIVSLDVDHFDQAFHFVNILSPVVDCFKVGIGPYTAFGDKLLDLLVAKNKKVFFHSDSSQI